MTTYAASEFVSFGLIPQAGDVFETGSPYFRQLVNTFTPDPVTSMIIDATINGRGRVEDKRTNLVGFGLATEYTLKYKNLRLAIAAAMRSNFPGEASVLGQSDINFIVGATHLDGTTSAAHGQITSVSGAFDDLIEYGGVTAVTHPNGGAEGLMLRISGSNLPQNDGDRRIKAVYDDGVAKIDIMLGYTSGVISGYGSPLLADTLDDCLLRVGDAVRDVGCSDDFVPHSALWEFCDMNTFGKWQGGWGLRAGGLDLNWTGKDAVTMTVPWIGEAPTPLQATDPSGQGLTEADLVKSPMIIGADLSVFALVPSHVIGATTTITGPMVMSGFMLTSLASALAGGVEAVTGISGNKMTSGVRAGINDASLTVGYEHANLELAEQLVSIGHQDTQQKVTADAIFDDTDGNTIVIGWPRCEPSPNMPTASTGAVTGSIELGAHEMTDTSGQMIHQEFGAIVP